MNNPRQPGSTSQPKDDPLPSAAVSALKGMIRKIENRAEARTKTLEQDIVLLIRDFVKGYAINYIHGWGPGTEPAYEIDQAVRYFCQDLRAQVAKIDTERFIESFSSKILEVSDAEKTSG
jgi:hypothetical protein